MWRVTVARASLAAVLVLVAATPFRAAAGQEPAYTVEDFFDDSQVRDIHVTASAADWATLKAHYLENTYYPCTFEWNGMVVGNATLRSRGTGTRNPQKPGLRIDFNRYQSAQRFLGLKYIVLDNFWTDPSTLRERITMKLLERVDLPAPRETPVRLFVNGEAAGFYAAVEPIDELFTARTVGSSDGYVYEFEGEQPYYFGYLGPDLDAYRIFDPKTRTKDPAALVWGPIEEMTRVINQSPDTLFERDVSVYLDLAAVVRQFALDSFMAEPDGLLGEWGMKNFYMYRPFDSLRFSIFRWDADSTFSNVEFPIMQRVSENVLAERALRLGYRDAYLRALEAAASAAADIGGRESLRIRGSLGHGRSQEDSREPALAKRPGWMESEIMREYRIVRDAARADPVKPFSNDEFEEDIQRLLDFGRRRPSFVLSEVARERRGSAATVR